jgi:hypothetical protein
MVLRMKSVLMLMQLWTSLYFQVTSSMPEAIARQLNL